MAYRRFTRSNSRQPRRSFSRFRPRASPRRTQPTRVWEMGQFFFETLDELPDGGEGQDEITIRYVRLAATRTIGDPATGQGVALISAARSLDIGGVVYDWAVRPAQGIDAGATPGEGRMFVHTGLLVDRMDGDALPTSVASWNPFLTSTPVASVSNAASTPGGNTLNNDFPNRILFCQTFELQFGAQQILNPQAGELYVPDGQLVDTRRGTVSKRLRLRLDDQVGLYMFIAYAPGDLFATGVIPFADWWARGNIYYRYNF